MLSLARMVLCNGTLALCTACTELAALTWFTGGELLFNF